MSATATASTSAILLSPVGMENAENILFASFDREKLNGIVEINSSTIGRGKNPAILSNKSNTLFPSFEIVGNEFSYAITLSYDPLLRKQNSGQNNIKVESLSVITEKENSLQETTSNRFVIDAKLNSNNSLTPGTYSTTNPVAVTIHFN